MSDNMVITNYDQGGLVIGNPEYEDGVLKFSGSASYPVGTILAKQRVAAAIAVTPGSNTGNGTASATVTAGDTIPLPGNYNLECTVAVTNGGVFKIEDPNGNIVADGIILRAGAGVATPVVTSGIRIVITDGSTDFSIGDKFALAVVADGDWVPFAIDGVGGAQMPEGILPVAESATTAVDKSFRPLIAGKVRTGKLSIAAGSTVTQRILDQLKAVGILAVGVTELNSLDNQ